MAETKEEARARILAWMAGADPEELRRLRDFVAGLEAARRKEAEDDGY